MTNIVRENIPRTIKDLVAVNEGAALIFPSGIPQSIPDPGWTHPLYPEDMRAIGFQFFERWADDIPNIPLDEVLKYSTALSHELINLEKCYPWYSVFMCGAIYEKKFVEGEPNAALSLLEDNLMVKIEKYDLLLAPQEALLYYFDLWNVREYEDEEWIIYEGWHVIDKAKFWSLKMFDRGL